MLEHEISHMLIPSIAVALFVAWIFYLMQRRHAALRREAFIRRSELPKGLFERLRKHHPNLSQKDCQLVAHALRQFFLAYLKSGRKYVSMPSQAVDDLWHEFILYTKNYERFCRQAFGGFLHHTPAVVLSGNHRSNAGLRRCWWFACKEEHINPRDPSRLPLLFALDAKLGIAGGFRYQARCDEALRERTSSTHCGGDFADSSVDGSTDGLGDSGSDASGGDASSSDGGCGGGGCGGD